MKKILLTFVLLVGVVFGLFAQKLTYQAVIRDNNQQLVTNTAVTANVVVKVGGTSVYTETVNGTTNNHGLLDIQFGNATLSNIDWPNATISVQVKNATTQVVYIPIEDRPVSAVPYALYAVNSASSQGSAGGISIVVKANESSCETIGDSYIDDNGHLQILTSTDPRVFTDAGEIRGPQGPQGIQGPKGDTGENGADGIGISSITGPVTSDLQDTYTINYTNGTTSTFVVTNGAQGEQGPAGESVEQVQADWAESDTTSKSFIKNKPTFPTSDQDLAELLQGLQNQINALQNTVASQDSTINALNEQVNPFVCGTSKVKDVDNNEYNTVKIGNQCWTKENLRTNVNGGVYPKRGDETVTGEDTITYGRLYTWDAMMNNTASTNYPESGSKVQGICPEGWHVPSDAEWTKLTTYVKSVSEYVCDGCSGTDDEWYTNCIAKALSQPTWWSNTGTGCNAGNTGDKANLTGFSAVPAGYCFGGNSYDFGSNASFWSATQYGDYVAWCRNLASSGSGVNRGSDDKDVGFSVRCLRDAGIGGGDEPSTPGEVSCEQVMECMADTLSRLNARITSQGETITAQGNTIDSLAHIVDSLSNITPVTPDTPVTPTDTFNCGTSKVKDVDNNEYNTVQIGNQCWTKENLRTKTHQYGQVWTKTDVDSAIYGRYYDWQAAMQIERGNGTTYTAGDKHRGICPEGWHVPSHAEWTALTDYVKSKSEYQCGGNAANIAKALSSPINTNEDCNAGNMGDKANATGFSAVPAGHCFDGNFASFGIYACFWSATQKTDYEAWYRYLDSGDSYVYSSSDYKENGFSVRCLRDAGIGGGDEPSEPSEPDTPVTPTDTFDCGTDKVKDAQNNEYNTVKIGNQCWTKENLRTNVGTGDYGYPTGVSGTADTVTYGRLYSWAAVMNGASASSDVPSGVRGICPEGWHVPSDGEWGNLINYVKGKPNEYKCGDDANNIANALSSETGWTNGSTPGCNAGDDSEKRNQTGFSAVPAGYFDTSSTNKGTHAYFWSTTDSGSAVYYRYLDNTSSSMNSGFEFSENMGLSVRCLRN